ncbi:unnamed protein product [Nyctereutes procyonoides]|uniref:nucleoside-diphosphate kinase n=1 Tax=Nyctereutes procyonoides TaxID=34880 RepID=A0A811Y1M3_NYCPR|nr:unnamed protein product [Nyctereutes procyonoides]
MELQPKQLVGCLSRGPWPTVNAPSLPSRLSVQCSLFGEIIKHFKQKGLFLIAMKLIQDHSFSAVLVKYLQSESVVAMAWEGLNVLKTGQVMLRETTPSYSKPGTIPGDFCIQVVKNITHGNNSM